MNKSVVDYPARIPVTGPEEILYSDHPADPARLSGLLCLCRIHHGI